MSPQYFIALFGLSAVYMSMVSQSAKARRWAPVVGLAGQPFWLYATGSAQQWGMFALCCAYTAIYLAGSYRAALADSKTERVELPSDCHTRKLEEANAALAKLRTSLATHNAELTGADRRPG